MNIMWMSLIIGFLYGAYDLFIKLGAGRIDPALGAMLMQIVSALTLLGVFWVQGIRNGSLKTDVNITGVSFVTSAGILIATALVLLFSLLQNKAAKAVTTIPTILILRNVVLVVLGILILKEKLSLIKSLGLALSLLGVYLISL